MNQWFLQEFAMLKKESAGEFDREDPTLADLALSKIFEEHFSEIEVENDFIEEAFILVFHKTLPWDLRDIAAEAREQDLQIGHYLELIADHREGKDWVQIEILRLDWKKINAPSSSHRQKLGGSKS